MPHVSGEELLRQITADYPDVPVVIVTGADDVETAVKCMKQGALDYIVKPVEKSRLVSSVKRGIELRELHRENQLFKAHILTDRLSRPEALADIVTRSPAMRSIFQYAEAVAVSPRPVLITGETGVGKESPARAQPALRPSYPHPAAAGSARGLDYAAGPFLRKSGSQPGQEKTDAAG